MCGMPPIPPELPDDPNDGYDDYDDDEYLEWVDVWVQCDTYVLLASVLDDDADDLERVWEQYDLTNRIGPPEHATYGRLTHMVDER